MQKQPIILNSYIALEPGGRIFLPTDYVVLLPPNICANAVVTIPQCQCTIDLKDGRVRIPLINRSTEYLYLNPGDTIAVLNLS